MTPRKEISLLPDEANVNSFSARVIRWVSSAGRTTIVITEALVIAAFLSRFWLDRRNSDLSETLRQQKAILESTKDFEKEYSLLQNRLKIIKKEFDNQPDIVSKAYSLSSSTPSNIVFNNLVFSLNEDGRIYADLKLSSYDEDSLVSFLTNLSLNPSIDKVDIKNIEKKPKETNYQVFLNLVFKPDKNDRT